jgi:16S rRNA (guanine966-N2)-methyltransferase
LEALSQGANSVVMVELQASVAANLRQNLKILRAGNAQVVHTDAVSYLQQTPQPFDIVFIDPPFRSDLAGRCAALIDERGWLKPEGLVYLEIPSRMRELPLPASWEVIYSKRAGQVGYHLARKKS